MESDQYRGQSLRPPAHLPSRSRREFCSLYQFHSVTRKPSVEDGLSHDAAWTVHRATIAAIDMPFSLRRIEGQRSSHPCSVHKLQICSVLVRFPQLGGPGEVGSAIFPLVPAAAFLGTSALATAAQTYEAEQNARHDEEVREIKPSCYWGRSWRMASKDCVSDTLMCCHLDGNAGDQTVRWPSASLAVMKRLHARRNV